MNLANRMSLGTMLLIGVGACMGTSSAFGETVYVSKTGDDTNDGLTWATAKLTVQAGLDAAVSGQEVWVAAGIYFENITLKDEVALYGGFVGSETELVQRDWTINVTTLDANQSGRVVTAPSGTTAASRIDGFIVRNGSASWGGGIYCSYASPTIANCTITENSAAYGGAVACWESWTTLNNCTIAENDATAQGGAIYCDGGFPEVFNCTITENSAALGGGVSCFFSGLDIVNCTISKNIATSGGGLYYLDCDSGIANSRITENIASSGGGICVEASNVIIADCTIAGNNASDGGGIHSIGSSPTFANTIVAFNSSGVYKTETGAPVLRYSCVFGNTAYNYSGLADPTGTNGNISLNPLFSSASPGPDATWGTGDDILDNLRLQAGSPCIDAGRNADVGSDRADLDGDGNTSEPLPFDLAGWPRFSEDPATADTGAGTPPIVDMGAYEYVPTADAEYEQLVVGVEQVGIGPLVPGPVYAISEGWHAIVAGDEDSPPPSEFMIAREFALGRVVVVGAEGLLTKAAHLDNGQLMLNSLDWLRNTGGTRVGYTTGHNEIVNPANEASFVTLLTQAGYALTGIPGPITAGALDNVDVLIVPAAWVLSQAEIDVMKLFVEQGKGLWLFGLGWSYPGDINDYAMNHLSEVFGARFIRGYITDPTDQYQGQAVLSAFYPDAGFAGLTDAQEFVLQAHANYGAALPSALEQDGSLRRRFVTAHHMVVVPTVEFGMTHAARSTVYNWTTQLMQQYPVAYAKNQPIDRQLYPTTACVRERCWRTWRDARDLSPDVVSDMATLGQLSGRRLDLLEHFGIVILDNQFLDQSQLNYLHDLLDAVPQQLHNVRSISVSSLIGNPDIGFVSASVHGFLGVGLPAAINIFDTPLDRGPENSFPPDITGAFVPVFTGAAAHELNHVVDSHSVYGGAAFSTRRAQLIADAGGSSQNYLRSMLPDGFFVSYPQEFFASIANEWFHDSVKTIQLGLLRLDAGLHHPINQALFFADVYSLGSDVTRFFQTNEQGAITATQAPIHRDPNGFIDRVVLKNVQYGFDLDASGKVTGYQETCLAADCCPAILYVDENASGSTQDGLSWNTAYSTLGDALDRITAGGCVPGRTGVIRVADGIYRPDQGSLRAAGDRDATFHLENYVRIEGGYPGHGSQSPDLRDILSHPTILSGDLLLDDAGGVGDPTRSENAYHVVNASVVDRTAVLDGVTIEHGHANGERLSERSFGGGILGSISNATFRNCVIQENYAGFEGGGGRLWSGLPLFGECTFRNNYAEDRGGAFFGEGAFHACEFLGNYSYAAGAIWSGILEASQCTFAGNTAVFSGAVRVQPPSGAISNCTFAANHSINDAGAVNCADGAAVFVVNSVLWANTSNNAVSEEHRQIMVFGGATAAVDHCCVQGWTGALGGAGNLLTDPLFVRMPDPGVDGQWDGVDDDYGSLQFHRQSPCIDAGNNAAVPADTADLDADGDTSEPLPFDLAGWARFFDDPATTDTGAGTPPIVDMGAYEFFPTAKADFDADGDVDSDDRAVFEACATGPAIPYNPIALPEPEPGCTLVPDANGHIAADFDEDNDVDQSDFGSFQRCYSGQGNPAEAGCGD